MSHILGDANIKAKAMELKNRPTNKTAFEVDMAMRIQPKAAKGENSNIVFLRPSHPDKPPPKGAATIRQNKSIDANHDPSFSSRSRYGRETVVKPSKIPSEAVIKLTVNAPKICNK